MFDAIGEARVDLDPAEMEIRLARVTHRPAANPVVQLEQADFFGHLGAGLGGDQAARRGGRDRRLLIARTLAQESAGADRDDPRHRGLRGSNSAIRRSHRGDSTRRRCARRRDGVHTIKFVATSTDWTGIDYIRFISNTVLPLHLISFTAQLTNDKANLKWVTEKELNLSHFNIERSSDGNKFEKLTEITSKGSGSYEMVDAAPLKGYNYYRLKMVDKDGKFSYSDIKKINVTTNGFFDFTLSPNPNKGVLEIVPSQVSVPVMVTIFDQHGRVVLIKKITGQISIDINHLSKGVYLVRLTNNVDAKIKRLIKE